VIVVHPAIAEWPEIQKLGAQGHTIFASWPGGGGPMISFTPDLVLGPTAHRMSEDERKWLPSALAEARRRRYGVKTAATSPEETDDL
jgi:hypothetical protein